MIGYRGPVPRRVATTSPTWYDRLICIPRGSVMSRAAVAAFATVAYLLPAARGDEGGRLIAEAEAAFRAGRYEQAAGLAVRAGDADPKDANGPALAGRAYAAARQYEPAVRAFTAALD